MPRIPECLLNTGTNPEYDELQELYDIYRERYGEIDWDGFAATNMAEEQEIKDAIQECLDTKKRMPEVKPEWCGPWPLELKL